jgi:thiol-disulfide isomerase/thioredoxin
MAMAERLLILTSVVVLAVALWLALRVWQAWRLRALQASAEKSPLLGGLVGDGPTLLYFTTEECAQCRFQQRPILERLAAAAPIPVVTLDAIAREDLARHFGIMTVPSTVLLDAQRAPVAINHGVAPLQKLQSQVAPLLV